MKCIQLSATFNALNVILSKLKQPGPDLGAIKSRSSSLSTELLFTPEVEHVKFVQLARRLRTFL